MKTYKYKNIKLTKQFTRANCVTHSGTFHVDDVISTIFLSKIIDEVILIRVPSINYKKIDKKLVYDIGLGEFDHHQKKRNGKRKNGIYYSSIGLLWKKFGKSYLKKMNVKSVDKVFDYIDTELIQYIDASDNMQIEYLKSKTSPDFIKLCNPQWNENISEEEGFIHALRLADEFWDIYIKHAIAEVKAIEIIIDKINKCDKLYTVFEREMPYRKAIEISNNKNVRYLIFKSRRECYDIRTIVKGEFFKKEILENDIKKAKMISLVDDLIYVDTHGKLCCTKTLEGAKKLIEYNERK